MSGCIDSIQQLVDEIVAMRDENVQLCCITAGFHVKLVGIVSNSPTNGFSMDIGVLMFQPWKEERLMLWLRDRRKIDSHGELIGK